MPNITSKTKNGKDLSSMLPENMDPYLAGISGLSGVRCKPPELQANGPSYYHPDNFGFFVTAMKPDNIKPHDLMDETYQRLLVETCMSSIITDFTTYLHGHESNFNEIIDHPAMGLARANVL